MDNGDYDILLNLYSAAAKGRNAYNMGEFKTDESFITLSKRFGLTWYQDKYAQYLRHRNDIRLSDREQRI